jgi:nitric oxide reductase activation protein
MRGFELIYPSNDKAKNQYYQKLILKSNEIWDEFTTGKQKHKQKVLEMQQKRQ